MRKNIYGRIYVELETLKNEPKYRVTIGVYENDEMVELISRREYYNKNVAELDIDAVLHLFGR